MTSPTPAELKRFYMALWMIESRAMASEPIPTELMDFLSRYGVPRVHNGKPVETFGEAWIAYEESGDQAPPRIIEVSSLIDEILNLTPEDITSIGHIGDGLWDGDHLGRQRFLKNVIALASAAMEMKETE